MSLSQQHVFQILKQSVIQSHQLNFDIICYPPKQIGVLVVWTSYVCIKD